MLRTMSRPRSCSTVAARAASGAVWVTMTRLASSPWPAWRTVAMDNLIGEDADGWLERADRALYQAKTNGRNQLVIAP